MNHEVASGSVVFFMKAAVGIFLTVMMKPVTGANLVAYNNIDNKKPTEPDTSSLIILTG